MAKDSTVARVWRGWTTMENADAYQEIVERDVIPDILEREIPGLMGAQVLRSADTVDDEVEFTTIIWFDHLDSVRGFMGGNYRKAHVPENARAVLNRFEAEAKHFHLTAELS